jgi:hypothetical protein
VEAVQVKTGPASGQPVTIDLAARACRPPPVAVAFRPRGGERAQRRDRRWGWTSLCRHRWRRELLRVPAGRTRR